PCYPGSTALQGSVQRVFGAVGYLLWRKTTDALSSSTGRMSIALTHAPFLRIRSHNPMFRKRPFSVTLLLWLVLSLSAWGAVRLLATLRWWNVLDEFEARLSPLYLAMTGAGWMVAGALLLWGLFRGGLWISPAILVSILVWIVQYWIERMFFESPRAN